MHRFYTIWIWYETVILLTKIFEQVALIYCITESNHAYLWSQCAEHCESWFWLTTIQWSSTNGCNRLTVSHSLQPHELCIFSDDGRKPTSNWSDTWNKIESQSMIDDVDKISREPKVIWSVCFIQCVYELNCQWVPEFINVWIRRITVFYLSPSKSWKCIVWIVTMYNKILKLEFIWNTAFLHFSVLVYCTVTNRDRRTRSELSVD